MKHFTSQFFGPVWIDLKFQQRVDNSPGIKIYIEPRIARFYFLLSFNFCTNGNPNTFISFSINVFQYSNDQIKKCDCIYLIVSNFQKKIDNRKKTGSSGGIDCKLNDIDHIVCDILGRDSPVLNGIETSETWDEQTISAHIEDEIDMEPFLSSSTSSKQEIATAEDRILKNPKLRQKQNKIRPEEDLENLKKKKLKLSIEIMEREKYLKELEIFKLEKELMVQPSPYTQQFYEKLVIIENNE